MTIQHNPGTPPSQGKLFGFTNFKALITNHNETLYRAVRDLVVWCQDNNLCLNVIKTKEMIVDYRKRRTENESVLPGMATVRPPTARHYRG